MADITFTCPNCSCLMQLPTALEGKQGKCPSCKAEVVVTPDNPETSIAPPANEPHGEIQKTIWKQPVVIGISLVGVIGVVVVFISLMSSGDVEPIVSISPSTIEMNEPVDSNSESFTEAISYNNRGEVYRQQGESENAIADFNKAIELDPTDAIAYSDRGVVYFAQDEFEKAITDFTKAIELDPADAVNYYYRGVTLEELGSTENAEADYAKAKELGYEPE